MVSLSRSNGGLATALSGLFNQETSLWIGWTGLRRYLTNNELRLLNIPPYLAPINLTPKELDCYYDQFSNGILWPLIHGLPATAQFTDMLWKKVTMVTEKFADALENIVKTDDIIWIHDYHLMLLPAELRRRGVTNRMGLFLHTPFPEPDMIRDLPYVNKLIQSLSTLDVLGLQTKRDTLRFDKVCATLQLHRPSNLIVKAFPIGIDFDSFDQLNDDPVVNAQVRQLSKRLGDAKLILSVSRLDYTKGILTQLRAFQMLLSRLPNTIRVTYRLNVAPSRESVPEYQYLRQDIERLVADINTRSGTPTWQPVEYAYENIGLQELAAWYQIADIHLNLPIADGMNLVAKEYVAARRTPGILVISDAMGAADQLRDAIVIPAENSTAAATALEKALAMSIEEKTQRWEVLRHNVKTEHVAKWAQNFLDQLVQGGT